MVQVQVLEVFVWFRQQLSKGRGYADPHRLAHAAYVTS